MPAEPGPHDALRPHEADAEDEVFRKYGASLIRESMPYADLVDVLEPRKGGACHEEVRTLWRTVNDLAPINAATVRTVEAACCQIRTHLFGDLRSRLVQPLILESGILRLLLRWTVKALPYLHGEQDMGFLAGVTRTIAQELRLNPTARAVCRREVVEMVRNACVALFELHEHGIDLGNAVTGPSDAVYLS